MIAHLIKFCLLDKNKSTWPCNFYVLSLSKVRNNNSSFAGSHLSFPQSCAAVPPSRLLPISSSHPPFFHTILFLIINKENEEQIFWCHVQCRRFREDVRSRVGSIISLSCFIQNRDKIHILLWLDFFFLRKILNYDKCIERIYKFFILFYLSVENIKQIIVNINYESRILTL